MEVTGTAEPFFAPFAKLARYASARGVWGVPGRPLTAKALAVSAGSYARTG